jgi:hypothetical protein
MFSTVSDYFARGRLNGENHKDHVSPDANVCSEGLSPQTSISLKRIGLIALLNFILFGTVFTLLTPGYETNDDLTMQLIASGFYTGHPSEYLVFTSIPIGWMLRMLYEATRGFNWYFWYLVSVHWASLVALSCLFLGRSFSWRWTALYVGFFAMVEVHLLLDLQFTTTAFIAGAAGVLLLVDGLKSNQPIHWPKILLGVGFVLVMLMVREPVAPFLAMVACPFLLERFGFSGWPRLVTTGLACVVLAVLIHQFNDAYYRHNPAWAEFNEYNTLRGKIHRTALENNLMAAAPAVGWSENDAYMFHNWYFADPEVYGSLAKMRDLYNRLEELARKDANTGHRSFRPTHLFLPKLLGGDAAFLMKLAILNAAWVLVVLGNSWRRCFFTLLATYGICLALAWYLGNTARFPQRVSINMPVFIFVICLYWTSVEDRLRRAVGFSKLQHVFASSPSRGLLPVAVTKLVPLWLVLNLFFTTELIRSLGIVNARHRVVSDVSRQIVAPIKGLSAGELPLLVVMPFDSLLEQTLGYYASSQSPSFSVVPYGWPTHSPIFTEILEANQLKPYSLAVVDQPHVFFLMEPRWVGPLETFYREHFKKSLIFTQVLNTDDSSSDNRLQLHVYKARWL